MQVLGVKFADLCPAYEVNLCSKLWWRCAVRGMNQILWNGMWAKFYHIFHLSSRQQNKKMTHRTPPELMWNVPKFVQSVGKRRSTVVVAVFSSSFKWFFNPILSKFSEKRQFVQTKLFRWLYYYSKGVLSIVWFCLPTLTISLLTAILHSLFFQKLERAKLLCKF